MKYLLLMAIGISGQVSMPAWSQPSEMAKTWIERPWAYRYLLYTDDPRSWEFSRKDHEKEVKENSDKAFKYPVELPVYFEPQWTLVPHIPDDDEESRRSSLHIVRLDITKDRAIQQKPLNGDQLWARLDGYGDIVLTPSETNPAYLVGFGEFFMGSPEAPDSRYSPTICSTTHGDTVPPDQGGRYGRSSKNDTWSTEGIFGCREWAAQLYDPNRPYIDVTSYEMVPDYDKAPDKKGRRPLKPASFIKPFIGFSRFSDPPKPVIGKYGDQWFCITDCPAGDKPGEIADIKAWAARSGWPVPQRPKNPRAFINKAVKPGDFVE